MRLELSTGQPITLADARTCAFEAYVKQWESGKENVSGPRYRAAYAEVFGVSEDELFNGGMLPSTVKDGVDPEDAGDDMRRRAALHLLAALGAGAAIPPGVLEEVLGGVEDALGNPLDVDEWDRTVHEYGQLLMVRPAGALIKDLTADLVSVGELLKRKMAESERRRMLRVSAGLSACLAIDLGDVGEVRAARTTWATAKRAADASGDTALRAWVRGRAAEDACWIGRPASVIDSLTSEAVAIAGGAPSAGLARAYAARTYAAVARGDVAQARSSLAETERVFEALLGQDGQSVFAFRETQMRWAESYVHTLVGDNRSRETVARALDLYPPAAHGPRSNLALMDAIALIREREIDAGLQRALTTLEDHRDATTAGRAVLVGHILQALPPTARQLPAARELRALTSA